MPLPPRGCPVSRTSSHSTPTRGDAPGDPARSGRAWYVTVTLETQLTPQRPSSPSLAADSEVGVLSLPCGLGAGSPEALGRGLWQSSEKVICDGHHVLLGGPRSPMDEATPCREARCLTQSLCEPSSPPGPHPSQDCGLFRGRPHSSPSGSVLQGTLSRPRVPGVPPVSLLLSPEGMMGAKAGGWMGGRLRGSAVVPPATCTPSEGGAGRGCGLRGGPLPATGRGQSISGGRRRGASVGTLISAPWHCVAGTR